MKIVIEGGFKPEEKIPIIDGIRSFIDWLPNLPCNIIEIRVVWGGRNNGALLSLMIVSEVHEDSRLTLTAKISTYTSKDAVLKRFQKLLKDAFEERANTAKEYQERYEKRNEDLKTELKKKDNSLKVLKS